MLAACGGDGGGSAGDTTGGASTSGGMSFPGTTSAAPTSTGEAPTSTEAASSTGVVTTVDVTGSSTGSPSDTGTTAGSTGDTTEGTSTGSVSAESSGGSSSTGAESTSTGTTAGDSSSSGEASSGGESTTGGVCGDGTVDDGEACDDGDAIDDDECSNDCVLPSCSDGLKNGAEKGVDCGGPCPACPVALLLGGNATKMVGAAFDGGSWTSTEIAAPTVDGVDLAISTNGVGIGVFRYTKINDPKDQQLQYVTWKAGLWSAPQQVPNATTRAAPTVDRSGTGAHVLFQGVNYQYYFAAFDGMGWVPAAEMIGSFGPGPGAVGSLGIDALFVFHDGAQNNQLTSRRRNANWLGNQVIDTETQAFDRQPAIAAIGANKAVAVHSLNDGGQLRWSVFNNGAWSAPTVIAGAQTAANPALTGLGADKAALAFRGNDGKLYVSTFDGTWQAPAPVANPNPAIFGPPALARGIGAADIELLYLDAGAKTIRHTRRVAGVWSAAVQIGNTALERVAIASGP